MYVQPSRSARQLTHKSAWSVDHADDFDVERFYRDAKLTQIHERTTDIQKNIIARELLGKGMV